MRLEGKTAIVTGAASGIGEAVAKGFAREGAQVVIADIDRCSGTATQDAIASAGGIASFIETDVSSLESVANTVATTVSEFGSVNILFNSAGIQLHDEDARTHEVQEAVWDRTIDINLKGMWRCMRSVIPEMLKHGGGSIINAASPTGMRGGAPGHSAYSTSKAGTFGLTRVAAAEYATDGIRINAIVPGAIETGLTVDLFANESVRSNLESRIPMGRLGRSRRCCGSSVVPGV